METLDPDDFNAAKNGDAIPATKDGIFAVNSPTIDMASMFQIVSEVEERVRAIQELAYASKLIKLMGE